MGRFEAAAGAFVTHDESSKPDVTPAIHDLPQNDVALTENEQQQNAQHSRPNARVIYDDP
jgi:hypothetical protein